MVEATRRYDTERSAGSWSGLKVRHMFSPTLHSELTLLHQDLAQIVGTDDARTIYDKLAELQSQSLAEKTLIRPRDDQEELEQAPNEVYILALATALQRAPDAEPCRVEVRVRQVLRQLGMCLESCRTYFIQSHRDTKMLHDLTNDTS